MALSATLAELETWIRQDADMQAPDDRVTSEECRNRINRSLAQLYDRLVLVDQEYFLKGAYVTSNGSGKYDIMNDLQTGVVRSASSIFDAGSGYTDGQTVTLAQGANASATGVVQVTGGVVTGLTITGAGSGYFDASYTQPSFSFLGLEVGPGNTVIGGAINVGTKTYFPYQNSSFGLIEVDPANQTWTQRTAGSGAAVTYRGTYVPSQDAIFLATANGTIWRFDIATSSWSSTVAVAPSFTTSGAVVYDAATALLYATDASSPATVYQIDPATVAVVGTTLLATAASIRSGSPGYLYYVDGANTDVYSLDTSAFVSTAIIPISSSLSDVLYVSAANKLYIACQTGTVKAISYDITTASATDLTATLASLPNYSYSPCFIGYDATQQVVYFSGFLVSPYVAKVDTSTDVATEAFEVTSATGALGTYESGTGTVISVCYVNQPPSPIGTAFEFYTNQTVTISTPYHIVVNLVPVSGLGAGAQAIVYIESDFYKCKGVWFTDGGSNEPDNGNWLPLRRFSWEAQNAINQSSLYDGVQALPLYRIVTEGNRDKLLISPDQLSGSYKLWYYPSPMKLLTPTDRFDGRAGWDEWIVKDVAIQLLMAEESIEQASSLKMVRDEIWQRLQLHAEDREAAQPQRIMDATLLSRRYGPRWGR
jgi:hypothetical protein